MGRSLVALLLIATGVAAQGKTVAKASVPLNRIFHGQVVALRGRTVTLYYDFEDEAQLKDFEEARSMRYLDACPNQARMEGGRLVLEGSTSVRHKLESRDVIHARFVVCPDKLHNIGAVVTEPVLGDFYVVYNLFEHRFTESGCMHIGAVGLREDEGAEDVRSGLVNYRDVFARDIRKTAKPGEDLVVEVSKERWDERFQAGRTKGKGSSKGKTKDMRDLKIGLFVHHSRAAFDDLTVTCTLSDEYLALEDLSVDLDGHADAEIDAYEIRGHDPKQVVALMSWPFVPKKTRERARAVLGKRKDKEILPLLLPVLRSPDKTARGYAIEVVEAITGETYGFEAKDRPLDRANAIARLEKAIR